MKTKMKKYEDGGSTRKARLEGRATKKMGKAQRTYKEAEATLSEAKSSGNPMDYADADQLYSRSARQGERAKKLKAKAAMMKKGGAMKKMQTGGSNSEQQTASRKSALADSTTTFPYTSTSGAIYATRKDLMEGRPTNPAKIKQGTKMKTGGMVNANSKVSALKVAGSKGVKSSVNPKAAASKVAKGRSGGTSTAPKTAVPKAKYGMGITKMKKK